MALDGQDKQGRFLPGNRLGLGAKPKRSLAELEQRADYYEALRQVVEESITPADFREIVCRAVRDAPKGNSRARDWIMMILGVQQRLQVDFTGDAPLQIAVVGADFSYFDAIMSYGPLMSL